MRWIRASDGLVQKEPGASSTANGDLVDWPQGERDSYVFTNVNTVINAWSYKALADMAQIAAALGKTEDAATWGAAAERLRGAINANLFENGRYKDGLTTIARLRPRVGVRRGHGRRRPGAARPGHAVHRRPRHGLLGLLRELPDRRALRRRPRRRRRAPDDGHRAAQLAAHHRAGRGLADGGVGPGAEVQHHVLAPVVGLARVPRVPRRARDRGARAGLQALQRQAAAGRAHPRRGHDADRARDGGRGVRDRGRRPRPRGQGAGATARRWSRSRARPWRSGRAAICSPPARA